MLRILMKGLNEKCGLLCFKDLGFPGNLRKLMCSSCVVATFKFSQLMIVFIPGAYLIISLNDVLILLV